MTGEIKDLLYIYEPLVVQFILFCFVFVRETLVWIPGVKVREEELMVDTLVSVPRTGDIRTEDGYIT